uniref:Uncharacterized protein n=1 Tax=Oryzias latipes TaxID=8090 RepID=A0A3B3HUE5_ORYLA
MCLNERDQGRSVRLQGAEVKKVQEFKYLGSTVQCDGDCGKEVKRRVQAGWSGWRKVSGVLCDRRVPARLKGKVYKTVVRPALLYGLETVAVRQRQEAEMEVAEMKMLRFSLGVTRLDRIRNEYIRGTAHVASSDFRCENGQCVSAFFVCDGDEDCDDGGDEWPQSCHAEAPVTLASHQCHSMEFRCGSGECIHGSWKCDGDAGCLDGSDEAGCSKFVVPNLLCQSYTPL